MVEREADDDWIILRTSAGRTLGLAASLTEDGFEAWAPSYRDTVKIGRSKLTRKVRRPLLATFVFVRARHLVDMLALAAMDEKPRRGAGGRKAAHAPFTVFHDNDRVPRIRDGSLEPLRVAEARRVPMKHRPTYPKGARVRVAAGVLFSGLTGVVQKSDGKITVVCFGDSRQRWKIETFLLSSDDE